MFYVLGDVNFTRISIDYVMRPGPSTVRFVPCNFSVQYSCPIRPPDSVGRTTQGIKILTPKF